MTQVEAHLKNTSWSLESLMNMKKTSTSNNLLTTNFMKDNLLNVLMNSNSEPEKLLKPMPPSKKLTKPYQDVNNKESEPKMIFPSPKNKSKKKPPN